MGLGGLGWGGGKAVDEGLCHEGWGNRASRGKAEVF